MADVMLPLFDNMPSVRVIIRDDPYFKPKPNVLAFYHYPHIIVRPDYVTSGGTSVMEMRNSLCHELIHAWLRWKQLDKMGEFLNEDHSEWFVKKALDINAQNIDGLKVDVEYLLTNPEAVHIYNRVAGIWIAPWLRDEETVVSPKPTPKQVVTPPPAKPKLKPPALSNTPQPTQQLSLDTARPTANPFRLSASDKFLNYLAGPVSYVWFIGLLISKLWNWFDSYLYYKYFLWYTAITGVLFFSWLAWRLWEMRDEWANDLTTNNTRRWYEMYGKSLPTVLLKFTLIGIFWVLVLYGLYWFIK